jgi:hypothetical protein
VGWFGPRGLASLVFALLALEELGSRADGAVAAIGFTVVLSVLAHGASAAPLAARYGRVAAARGPESGASVPDLPVRGLPRPRDAGSTLGTAVPQPNGVRLRARRRGSDQAGNGSAGPPPEPR